MKEYEEILQKTNNGLDIFSYYLGPDCLKKKFKSPFRDDDNRPSCHIYLNEPVGKPKLYFMQDFGDSKNCGNCFVIAAKVLGMNIRADFRELLKRIDLDLSLGIFGEPVGAPKKRVDSLAIKKTYEKAKTSSIKSFMPVMQSFASWEKEYWNGYGIDEVTLRKYNVYSLRSVAFEKIDGKKFNIYGSRAIPAYGYFFNGMTGIKVYRPTAQCRFLYAGNLPNPYIFGWEQLPENGSMVIITGGEKDVMSLASHGFPAIAFNSETASISRDVMEKLAKRFKKIIFLYDADQTGVKESEARVKEFKEDFNVSNIHLPLAGTKKEKDISDFFLLGKTAEDLKKLL